MSLKNFSIGLKLIDCELLQFRLNHLIDMINIEVTCRQKIETNLVLFKTNIVMLWTSIVMFKTNIVLFKTKLDCF